MLRDEIVIDPQKLFLQNILIVLLEIFLKKPVFEKIDVNWIDFLPTTTNNITSENITIPNYHQSKLLRKRMKDMFT